MGCKINLSKRPLIPRAETEFWVEKVLPACRQAGATRKIKVLDIFAGSGCIGLVIEKNIKNAQVFFADKYQYFEHKNFIKSDVFSNIKDKFDYIFANPPYVAKNKIKQVQRSVLKYEPHSALFAGKDGLFYIKKFLKQAKEHLNPGGKIFMEFSPEQKNAIGELLKSFDYKAWEFNKDQFDRFRWVVIT